MIVVTVQIVDEETGAVQQAIVKMVESTYGGDVERAFEKLGEQCAQIVHPGYDD